MEFFVTWWPDLSLSARRFTGRAESALAPVYRRAAGRCAERAYFFLFRRPDVQVPNTLIGT